MGAGAAVALLVGCGPTVTHTPPGSAASGNLMIVAHDVPDDRGMVYFEGSLRYVRVAADWGATHEWQTPDGEETTISVPPGKYEITAWERICGGNCDNLEPATNQCSAVLEIPVDGNARVDINWTVPNPCVIETAIFIS
jgi:hypothetical protein